MRRIVLLMALAVAPLGCGKTYAFDPIAVGDQSTARTPKPKSNSQFVRAIYADVVGRAPAVYDFEIDYGMATNYTFPIDEQKILLQAFDGIGDPDPLRAVIVAGLVDSSEVTLPKKADVDATTFVTD